MRDPATERYLRTVAAELATNLPENPAYAHRVLALMAEFYDGFLVLPEEPGQRGPRLVTANEAISPRQA